MGNKIFCIGFHKTGTTSIGEALKILGYRVTGPNWVDNPRIDAEVIDLAKNLVPKYDAFQDNPWPIIYQDMDRLFPGSKFILTVRETSSWINSQVSHFSTRETPMRRWIYGVGCPQGHEAIYVDSYNLHNEQVKNYFRSRPDDLLVIDITRGDGWEEICQFLEVQQPSITFPHTNAARSNKRFRISDLISKDKLRKLLG